jgi:hypothetical protein
MGIYACPSHCRLLAVRNAPAAWFVLRDEGAKPDDPK